MKVLNAILGVADLALFLQAVTGTGPLAFVAALGCGVLTLFLLEMNLQFLTHEK